LPLSLLVVPALFFLYHRRRLPPDTPAAVPEET